MKNILTGLFLIGSILAGSITAHSTKDHKCPSPCTPREKNVCCTGVDVAPNGDATA